LNKIKIGDKFLGNDFPCFTIAEAGANHDGNLDKAKQLIDAAIKAKSDSIKFQTYTAEKLTTKTAPKYWKDENQQETQFDVFKNLDSLSSSEWKEIFEYAKKQNITCFSTPFDEDSVDLLYSFDVPAFKIASADITHIPLITHVAKKGLPIFISTGMATIDDVQEAVDCIRDTGNEKIIIMHCMTSYPTKPEDANLDMISTLAEKFPEYIIGYSDHTLGIQIPTFSVYYGANVIEKHFTFDNNLETSPDHRLSLNTDNFLKMVENIRLTEISKGSSKRINFTSEIDSVKFARRSIVSTVKIPKGTIISKEMLGIKRPGTGIYPKFFDNVIGKESIKDIQEDVPIQWDDLSP